MHVRYERERMKQLWSEDSKFSVWLRIETAVLKARSEHGEIPDCIPDLLTKYAKLNPKRIFELDALIDHDMNAFLQAVSESIMDGMQKDGYAKKEISEVLSALHAGLTSYDIEDTALAIRLKEATLIILDDLSELIDQVLSLAIRYKDTPQIGRTHLQHAEPITLGLKLLGWYRSLCTHKIYFKENHNCWEDGKISGAVGSYSHLAPFIEESVGKHLRIGMAIVSGQIVSREGLAYLMGGLSHLASSLARFARDIEHLSSTEVGEIFEGHAKSKQGSSAMPHKSLEQFSNPNKCERIYSLAKIVRANAFVASENIDIRHEQDLTQSASERIIISGSFVLVDYMVVLFARIIKELKVDPKRMLENIWMTGGLIFSQHVTIALMDKGMPREQARKLVTKLCVDSAKRKGKDRFMKAVRGSKEVQKRLTSEDIEQCFSLEHHLRNVCRVFERFFD